MKIIEEKLSALDAYFVGKKESEKWMMILGVAGTISYLAYTSFLPITEKKFNETETTKKSLNVKIADNKGYLASITRNGNREFYVNQYTADIKKKEKNLTFINQEIKDIDTSLLKLSDMLFNEKSWSIFLNSLTNKAETEGIELKYIKNKYVDNNGSFGHILEISVGAVGNYKNIVKFMNDIEQNTLVTDIYGSDLSLDSDSQKIFADINISVWGINN